MHKNVGVGKLLVTAALREHHRVLDNTIKLEDWSRAEALFVQVCTGTPTHSISLVAALFVQARACTQAQIV